MGIFTKQIKIPISSKTEKILSILFLPIILFTFSYILFFSGGESSTSSTKPYTPDEIELHTEAQQFIKQGLKSPSTAEFPVLPYEANDLGSGQYRIVSYVDSQNSFGAMIRSNWSVLMRLEGERWILEKMVIGNKVIFDVTQKE